MHRLQEIKSIYHTLFAGSQGEYSLGTIGWFHTHTNPKICLWSEVIVPSYKLFKFMTIHNGAIKAQLEYGELGKMIETLAYSGFASLSCNSEEFRKTN